jgi:hypothetical protein
MGFMGNFFETMEFQNNFKTSQFIFLIIIFWIYDDKSIPYIYLVF